MKRILICALMLIVGSAARADWLTVGLPHAQADADIAAAKALVGTTGTVTKGTDACPVEIACLFRVRDGELDVTVTSSLSAAAVSPVTLAFDLPYFLPLDHLADRLIRLPEVTGDGLDLIAVTPDGSLPVIATTSRRITHPDDMAGLRFHVADLASELLVIATGAELVELPPSAVFDALQVGEIDGVILDLSELMRRNLVMAGVSYATVADHAFGARLWWARSPSDDVLRGRRAAMIAEAARVTAQRNRQAEEDFVDGGGDLYRLTEDERAAFRALMSGYRAAMLRQVPEAAAIDEILGGR